jgi:hypothetical protein
MTMQDIYSWVQIGLQVLIGGGVVAGIYRYFGVLKRLIEGQEKTIATQAEQMKALKATIDAQAEQMKAQSTVLQDFERLNTLMKQVMEVINPEAQLKREQAFQARLERETNHRLQEMATEVRRTNSFVATITEAMGEMRHKLAETKSTLTVITRARRESLEELERQLTSETESPQDS